MYSLVNVNNEEIKKAKRVNKDAVKSIIHKEYANVLFNKNLKRHKMKRIQSKLHRTGTYDDKRYIRNDGINSLAKFYKNVRSQ